MTCPYCKKEVAPGSRYCLNCGTLQEPAYLFEEPRFPEPELPEVSDAAAELEFPVIPKQPAPALAPEPAPAPVAAPAPKQAPKPAAVKPKLRAMFMADVTGLRNATTPMAHRAASAANT